MPIAAPSTMNPMKMSFRIRSSAPPRKATRLQIGCNPLLIDDRAVSSGSAMARGPSRQRKRCTPPKVGNLAAAHAFVRTHRWHKYRAVASKLIMPAPLLLTKSVGFLAAAARGDLTLPCRWSRRPAASHQSRCAAGGPDETKHGPQRPVFA